MSTRVAERRRSQRVPAVYPAAILDEDGYSLAEGRTADISECGVFVMANGDWDPVLDSTVIVQLELPGFPSRRKREKTRIVMYRARVVRTNTIGQMLGIGLELLTKIY